MKLMKSKKFIILVALMLALPQMLNAGVKGQGAEPMIIDAGPNNAYRTKMAFDLKGNAFAVFEQKSGDSYNIYANRYVEGKGWEKPVVISDLGFENSDLRSEIRNPRSKIENSYRGQVAFDNAGNAIAAFKQGDAIYANRYLEGKGWQGPIRISDLKNSQSTIRNPKSVDGQQIIFDREGNGVVVFEQFDGKKFGVFANRYVRGKGWQGVERISDCGVGIVECENKNPKSQISNPKSAYFPYPLFDNRGSLHVIYYQEEGDGLEVYVNRFNGIGKKWGNPVRITDGYTKVKQEDWSSKRSFVTRGISSVYNPLFWAEVKKRVYAGSYNYTKWETPSKIDARYRDAYRPSLVVDQKGNITALFVRWDGEHLRGYISKKIRNLKSEIRNSNDGWSEPMLIDGGKGNVEYVRAAVNSRGEIAVVFAQWAENKSVDRRQNTGRISDCGVGIADCENPKSQISNHQSSNLRVHARVYSPVTGWGESKIIDAGAKNVFNPSVVFKDNGEIVAVWCQWEKYNVKSYVNIYRKQKTEVRGQKLEDRGQKSEKILDFGFGNPKSEIEMSRVGWDWGKATRLENEDGETCGVKVFAGPYGKVIVLFEQETPYPGKVRLVNRIFAVELVN